MRKAIMLIVLFLSICTVVSAQESKEEPCLTSGKWRIESLKIGDEKEDFSDCLNSWLVFKEDGSYQLMIRKNEKIGHWELESNKNILKFENEGTIDGFKILKLTNKELLFSTIEDNIVYTMTLKK